MAKRRPARERDAAADTPDGLPDRDALLAFIRDSKNAVTLRDVQRALGFRSAARRRVQDVLNQLAGEGAIERIRGQIYRARRRLPEVAVIEITRIDADGDVFGKIAERGAADEGLELLVVAGRHAPSRGDRVLARLSVREGGEPRALVLRPLERTAEFVVGVFEGEHRGGGMIAQPPTAAAPSMASWCAPSWCASARSARRARASSSGSAPPMGRARPASSSSTSTASRSSSRPRRGPRPSAPARWSSATTARAGARICAPCRS